MRFFTAPRRTALRPCLCSRALSLSLIFSNLLYGVIAEFCTEGQCPVMCAGPKYEYMWADGAQIRKPIAVSAPRYVDYLMTWVQGQLDDERLFPTQNGVRPEPTKPWAVRGHPEIAVHRFESSALPSEARLVSRCALPR